MSKMYVWSYKWERSLWSFRKYSSIHVKTLVSGLFRAWCVFNSFHDNITSAFIVDNKNGNLHPFISSNQINLQRNQVVLTRSRIVSSLVELLIVIC